MIRKLTALFLCAVLALSCTACGTAGKSSGHAADSSAHSAHGGNHSHGERPGVPKMEDLAEILDGKISGLFAPHTPGEPEVTESVPRGTEKPEITEAATERSTETVEIFTEVPTEAPTEAAEDALDINDPVILLIDEEGTVDDYAFYDWEVPGFNCDTEYARAANQEILDDYNELLANDYQNIEQNGYVYYREIKYQLINADPFFTILISATDNSDDSIVYSFHTINLHTGGAVTNDEMLAACRISKDDFIENARQCAVKQFNRTMPEEYGDRGPDPDSPMHGAWQEALDLTISEEQINFDMDMYVDGDGNLILMSVIGVLAGAGHYQAMYPYEVLQ